MDALHSGQRQMDSWAGYRGRGPGLEGTQIQARSFPPKEPSQGQSGSSRASLHCRGPAPLNYIIAYLLLVGLEILEPSA